MSLDFAPDLRDALLAAPAISGLLGEYASNPAIFTRLPVPADAPAVYIVIPPVTALTDEDGLDSLRPVIVRDIAVFGKQPDDYRTVEQIAYTIRDLFHRQRFSVINTGYDVVSITASGPLVAPVSDSQTVGRLITLTIQTRKKP